MPTVSPLHVGGGGRRSVQPSQIQFLPACGGHWPKRLPQKHVTHGPWSPLLGLRDKLVTDTELLDLQAEGGGGGATR